MNDDYLWNRSGTPDPEIVRLEHLLGTLRHQAPKSAPRKTGIRNSVWIWSSVAAALLVAAFLAAPLFSPGTNWRLPGGSRIRSGQLIETHAQAARIQSDDTGEVTIDPNSRLRLIASNDRQQLFDLKRGVIHAFIWAPPGQFVVDTPASKTIDLGCRYTLQVSEDGTGRVTVETGWVAFEHDHVESFIPAEAACEMRPGRGPGTPYFTDAPAPFVSALASFDLTGDSNALHAALAIARRRDALSLWHLMGRTRGDQRARVFDRLAQMVTLSPLANREAVLRGDPNAMDAAWNALDLGNTDWWRIWKNRL